MYFLIHIEKINEYLLLWNICFLEKVIFHTPLPFIYCYCQPCLVKERQLTFVKVLKQGTVSSWPGLAFNLSLKPIKLINWWYVGSFMTKYPLMVILYWVIKFWLAVHMDKVYFDQLVDWLCVQICMFLLHGKLILFCAVFKFKMWSSTMHTLEFSIKKKLCLF